MRKAILCALMGASIGLNIYGGLMFIKASAPIIVQTQAAPSPQSDESESDPVQPDTFCALFDRRI